MQPLNGPKFWEKKGIDPPQPPSYKKTYGRPARNRRKEGGEYGSGHELSRKGRVMTYQACFEKGHNKKICPSLKEGASQIKVCG